MNGLSYSKFMHGLKLADVDMNRKMLAELAVNDKEGFATLAALAKENRSREGSDFFCCTIMQKYAEVSCRLNKNS